MASEKKPDRVGQVLLGKLRVIRHLGGGGMGDVYEVEHLLTHHRRALKIVRSELARQPRYVERLLREASVAGRLKTPYVAETLDAGRLEDGSAYVLMELLEGRSLYDVLEIDPRLAQRRVANIMSQVAEGMAVAHAAGIVHRDLKPENIFLVGEEAANRVKILDFGISKIPDALGEAATRLTREGSVIGTPFYMSPEQAAGREVDARADIWAMGVITYEALTGKVPFNGKTVGEVMMLIGAGMYPPVRARRPDVDEGFAAVIARALRPDPRDRYESAEAMRRDLVQYATNEPAARAKTISDGATTELARERPLPPPPTLPLEEEIARARASERPEPKVEAVPSSASEEAAPPLTSGSSESTRQARQPQGIALALVVALVAGVTIFISTSSSSSPSTSSSHSTSLSPSPSPSPSLSTSLSPSPSTSPSPSLSPSLSLSPELIDAGTLVATPPPATTREDDGPRPRVHRTRAEIVGLEGNPYGTP